MMRCAVCGCELRTGDVHARLVVTRLESGIERTAIECYVWTASAYVSRARVARRIVSAIFDEPSDDGVSL